MTSTPSPSLPPAVRQALAYVAIVGSFPKGIHLGTLSAAHDRVESADYETTKRFYTVPNAEDYAATPLWKAHAALLGAGFSFRGNVRIVHATVRIRKELRYDRLDDALDGFEAVLYPQGHLFLNRVQKGHALHRRSDTAYVSANNAGTLPDLVTNRSR
jgi:hypothetical protein